MTVVMVTGHRVLPFPETVPDKLDAVLTKLAPTKVICGGAAGADRMFAEAALRCRVPLHLMLPNIHYRKYYPGVVPDEVMAAASEVSYVVARPTVENWRYAWDKGKWWRDNFTRNRVMVASSDLTVVVSERHPHELLGYVQSGTAGTVREVLRARGEGHKVVWVTPAPGEPGPAKWVALRVAHAVGDWSDFQTT